jgi:hypothetical protein
MHTMLQRLVLVAAICVMTTACADADPCDTLPKDFVFTSVGECGRDLLSLEELGKIERGELAVVGLPYAGKRVDQEDLPVIEFHSTAGHTRDVCRACQSVCDCWLTGRRCKDTAAANKSMPKFIDKIGDFECGTNPGPPAGHALACRGSQCVWEAVDPTSE